MNKSALVYFHQGWTDIVVCLPLINYYRKKYDNVTVLIRSEARELVEFYILGLSGVKVIYLETDNGRWYGNIERKEAMKSIEYYPNGPGGTILVPVEYDMMCHAEHDRWRVDVYKDYWPSSNKPYVDHFTEMFYVYYGIDFIERINSFEIQRDYEMEIVKYEIFINQYGNDYILYHDDEENHLSGGLHVSTKIDFGTKSEGVSYVNLNKKTSKFFDFIKILQNSKELHFVDSIWATLVYQLDAKYSILGNKPVTVYCKRGHYGMFTSPVLLKNWKLV